MSLFANVIVDISIEKLDRPFQYIIPDALADRIYPGVQIEAPFGNRTIIEDFSNIGKSPVEFLRFLLK